MTRLESDAIDLSCPKETLYRFLCVIENYRLLMPPQVDDWESQEDACRFRIKGLARVGMRITRRNPEGEVILESEPEGPFRFTLACRAEATAAASCRLILTMDADLNPMLRSMASVPLRNFLNLLAGKCREAVS